MSRSLDNLKPHVRTALVAHRADLGSKGINTAITFTTRTDMEQKALYAQGRRSLDDVNSLRRQAGLPEIGRLENRYTVTNCDGIKLRSRHQDGLAYDLAVIDDKGGLSWHPPLNVLKTMGESGEALGMEWGGRWPPLDADGIGWDRWHFQGRP